MTRSSIRSQLVGLAAATLLCGGCAAPMPERFRVTLVGVDGATWRVIDPLLDAGELPTLARLIDDGVRLPLRSQSPMLSPAIWTTIATGVSREHHGIERFQAASGRLVSSGDRRVPALWTIASAAGRRSAVLNWWATRPAEPIDGVVVSEGVLKVQNQALLAGRFGANPWPGLVHPPSVAGVLDALMAVTDQEDYRLGREKTGIARTPHFMRFEDGLVVGALLEIRRRLGPFDLELLLLRGVDAVSHVFWQYYEPTAPAYPPEARPSPAAVRRFGRVVEDHYVYVDTLLATLVEPAEPDHVVLVLSDHGFEAGPQGSRGTLFGTHRTEAALDGILIVGGAPVRRGVRLERASILDVAPTVLHLLGLPVAESQEGRVLTEMLEPAWATAHPVRTVPAHAAGTPPPSEAPPTSPIDETLRDELRALGYIE